MPKQKTRKSVLNRFKVTKKGKIIRRRAFRRHLKAGKSRSRLRNLKKSRVIKGHFAKKVRKVLGK